MFTQLFCVKFRSVVGGLLFVREVISSVCGDERPIIIILSTYSQFRCRVVVPSFVLFTISVEGCWLLWKSESVVEIVRQYGHVQWDTVCSWILIISDLN